MKMQTVKENRIEIFFSGLRYTHTNKNNKNNTNNTTGMILYNV